MRISYSVGYSISHCGKGKISVRWDFSSDGSESVSGVSPAILRFNVTRFKVSEVQK